MLRYSDRWKDGRMDRRMYGWIDEWIDTKNSDLNDSLFNLKIKMMYFSKKLKMATNNI